MVAASEKQSPKVGQNHPNQNGFKTQLSMKTGMKDQSEWIQNTQNKRIPEIDGFFFHRIGRVHKNLALSIELDCVGGFVDAIVRDYGWFVRHFLSFGADVFFLHVFYVVYVVAGQKFWQAEQIFCLHGKYYLEFIQSIQRGMVLTQNQKKQLNKDLLEYLANNQYTRTAKTFAEELDTSLQQVDAEGRKLQMKWKSILTLQKKITNLQEKIIQLEDDLTKAGGPKKLDKINIQDMYLPKKPAKFELKGHKGPISSIAFHPQFTQIATSSQDGSVKIWEFQTGEYQRTVKGHTNPVNCVNYEGQGRYMVTSSSDLTIKLWDLNNDYQCMKTFYGHDHNVSFVNFCMGGDYIISASRDKTIKLWEITTGYCKRTYLGHEGWVRKVILSADEKTLASCSDDQSVCIWAIDKESPTNRFFVHQHVIEDVIFVEGEKSSVLMNSQFLKHKFTQEAKLNALKQLKDQGINGISSYQQNFILTCSRDKLIRLYLCQNGQLLHTFVGHDNWVRSLALHPTGKYMYSVSDDKTFRTWDLTYGKEKNRIEAHEHFISSLAFNKKYGVIATGGNDMTLKLWHLK